MCPVLSESALKISLPHKIRIPYLKNYETLVLDNLTPMTNSRPMDCKLKSWPRLRNASAWKCEESHCHTISEIPHLKNYEMRNLDNLTPMTSLRPMDCKQINGLVLEIQALEKCLLPFHCLGNLRLATHCACQNRGLLCVVSVALQSLLESRRKP